MIKGTHPERELRCWGLGRSANLPQHEQGIKILSRPEMAWPLKSLAALPDGLDLIPSTDTIAHNDLELWFWGIQHSLLASIGIRHAGGAQIYKQVNYLYNKQNDQNQIVSMLLASPGYGVFGNNPDENGNTLYSMLRVVARTQTCSFLKSHEFLCFLCLCFFLLF